MALKAVLGGQEEFDSLPEGVQEHYTESNGVFSLSVEGQTKRENELGSKVTEFRDNNVQLMKEKENLTGQLTDIQNKYLHVDPDMYRQLLTEREKLEKKDAKVVTNTDLTSQIQEAVASAVQPIQNQLNEAKQREAEAQKNLDNVSFKNIVQKAALESGVRNEALDDILGRARAVGFTLHEGKAVIVNDGIVKFSDDRPDQPLSLNEWMTSLQRDGGSHLFKPSRSTGDQDQTGADSRLKSGSLKDPSMKAFSRNLEGIASGKVVVTRTANRDN